MRIPGLFHQRGTHLPTTTRACWRQPSPNWRCSRCPYPQNGSVLHAIFQVCIGHFQRTHACCFWILPRTRGQAGANRAVFQDETVPVLSHAGHLSPAVATVSSIHFLRANESTFQMQSVASDFHRESAEPPVRYVAQRSSTMPLVACTYQFACTRRRWRRQRPWATRAAATPPLKTGLQQCWVRGAPRQAGAVAGNVDDILGRAARKPYPWGLLLLGARCVVRQTRARQRPAQGTSSLKTKTSCFH